MKKDIKDKFLFLCLVGFFLFALTHFALAQEEGKIEAFGQKATIYYYSELHKENAQWAKEAIEYVWPIYKSNTGVEPQKINVYISDTFVQNQETQWVFGMEEYEDDKCLIFISNLDKEKTQSTIAHEMFHCWQEAIGLQSYIDNSWFWEATAVWAESWMYPSHNTEHRYLSEIFPYFNSYFFDSYRAREYGSYLFFYYIFQKNNFSPNKVIDLVKGLRTKNQIDLFSSDASFDSSLKEYALWNWNDGPARKYQDRPAFPEIYPSGASLVLDEIKKDDRKSESLFVPGGGVVYLVEKIDDEIDKLVLNLEEANKLKDSHLSVQALINIGNNWVYQDWSHLKEKKFCRHRANEKVRKIVLIISNSKLKPEGDGSTLSSRLKIDSTGECPKVWHGKTTITSKGSNPMISLDSELVLQEELKLIVDEYGNKCFAVTKQEVSFNSNESTNMICPLPGCGGSITQIVKETGTTVRYPPENASFDDFICRFYQNKGEDLKFNYSTEIYGECDYVTRVETSNFNCSCSDILGGSPEGESETEHGLCHSFFGLDILDEIPAKLENNGNLIKGKETGSTPDGSRTVEIKWNYIND